MNGYDKDGVVLIFGGHRIKIEGWADGEPVFIGKPKLWWEPIAGSPYSVMITCEDYRTFRVDFTEQGFEENIKYLKPSIKSPFKANSVN